METYDTGVYDKNVTKGLFNLRIDTNTRGQRDKIFKEPPRLEIRKHSCFFQTKWLRHQR